MVIKQTIDKYPVQSPQVIPGFFDRTKYTVGGKEIALNDIENKILRPTYKDARLHFVLVCGAKGCPPITRFAYVPSQLEDQLTQQTELALNDESFIYQSNGTSNLSEIFNWYSVDFGKNKSQLIEFINSYRIKKLSTKDRISYYTYDWNLNDTKNLVQVSSQGEVSEEFNLQTFTPGNLLAKGKVDVTLFNTLYTQTRNNWQGVDYESARENFYSSLLQVTFGTSKSKRINLGVDVKFTSTGRSTDLSPSSIAAGFRFKNNDSSRVGITAIGPRIKISPFKGSNSFSIQSTFLIPTIKQPEGGTGLYWADWDRFTWWNQFYYTTSFNKFQLFAEADLLFVLRKTAIKFLI